jgi:hypothetical protein
VTLGVAPVTISVVDFTGYTEYNTESVECMWVITGVPPIELKFISYDTEIHDYMKVYRGNGTDGRLLRKHSGSVVPPPLQSSAGTLTVTFSYGLSWNTSKGFVAVFQAAPGAPFAQPPLLTHRASEH